MLCTTTPCHPPPRTVLASSRVVASRTSPLFIWPLRTLIMVFPVMYRCQSWTIKKAERQRIDAFELWCWRRLLRVPWTARRSNQPILKEINPEYSLEELTLKLKLPYFGPPDAKSQLIRKDPDAGKDWGQKKKGTTEDEMVGWHHWHNRDKFEWTAGASEGQRSLVCCSQSQTWLSGWTTITLTLWPSPPGACTVCCIIPPSLWTRHGED